MMMGLYVRPSNFTSTYTQDVMMIITTKTAARCRYGNVLVIFKGGCYQLLYSITKSSFDFWLQQAYHAVSQIDSAYSISHIQCPILHLVLLFIQIGTRTASFWCGGVNNYLRNINFYNHISFFFGIIKYIVIKET